MVEQFVITADEWTPITEAGDAGCIWLDEDDDAAAGAVDVRVVHSTSGIPEAGEVTKGKRVYKPRGNNDLLLISPDTESDIYYARCKNAGDSATLSVDIY